MALLFVFFASFFFRFFLVKQNTTSVKTEPTPFLLCISDANTFTQLTSMVIDAFFMNRYWPCANTMTNRNRFALKRTDLESHLRSRINNHLHGLQRLCLLCSLQIFTLNLIPTLVSLLLSDFVLFVLKMLKNESFRSEEFNFELFF